MIPLSCRRQENPGLSRLKSGGALTFDELKSEAQKKMENIKEELIMQRVNMCKIEHEFFQPLLNKWKNDFIRKKKLILQ